MMGDPRDSRLASLVVRYALGIQPGEVCLVHAIDIPIEMVEALVQEVYAVGGIPLVELDSERIRRSLTAGATPGSFNAMAQVDGYRMRQVDTYIGIRGPVNPLETSDLPGEKNSLYMSEYYRHVHTNIRIKDTRWVVMRYPTTTMALLAGMSTKGFADYYYKVTIDVDYERLSRAMEPAVAFLQRAQEVRILGPGTDLSFSIAGMHAIPCDGHVNIPDGEIYTAPVRDSVNGVITYTTASTYQGFTFRDIRFEFEQGRIIRATANDTARLNAILDTDEGARYIGEFALGCNPAICSPMDNTLFDEKIMGSFHLTPGHAYDDCDNGNRSAIHWDLVSIQTPAYGGGEIYMDGELIRADGRFCHSAFLGLNPDALLSKDENPV